MQFLVQETLPTRQAQPATRLCLFCVDRTKRPAQAVSQQMNLRNGTR